MRSCISLLLSFVACGAQALTLALLGPSHTNSGTIAVSGGAPVLVSTGVPDPAPTAWTSEGVWYAAPTNGPSPTVSRSSTLAALLNELLEHHQTLIREQKYARSLSLLHRIDDAAFSDIMPEHFLRTLINECTRFLEMDFGFLIGAGPGNDDYQVLAASGNADEAF